MITQRETKNNDVQVKVDDNNIVIDKKSLSDFLMFMEEQKTYLDTGLGAFHTDNHGNW